MKFTEILLALFGLISVGVILGSALQLYRAFACKKWLVASGIVTNTTIKITGSTGAAPSGGMVNQRSHLPVINYDYTVKGRTYSNNTRCFGDYGASEKRAKVIIARYPKDKEIQVFYNPSKHSMSVLETNLRYGLFLAPFIAFVMLGSAYIYFFT